MDWGVPDMNWEFGFFLFYSSYFLPFPRCVGCILVDISNSMFFFFFFAFFCFPPFRLVNNVYMHDVWLG